MTPNPYIPSDDEAVTLLDAVETEQDTGRKGHIVDLLGRYAAAKREAGLEPFQPDPTAKRDRLAKVNAFYEGLDTVEGKMAPDAAVALQQALAGSPDPEEVKARSVNQAWLLAQQPELAGQVNADWASVRRQVAKTLLNRDGDLTDRDLYAGIAGHLTTQKAKTEAANAMLAKVQDAAFGGEQDWLAAYRAASAGLSTPAADGAEPLTFTPAERDAYRAQAQKVFQHASTRATALRPIADQLLVTLSRETNAKAGAEVANDIGRAEFIPVLAEMSETDRFLVYRMLAGQADKGVETDAATKGATQKVAEKFGRQVRDIALDQIASFEQAELAHALAVGGAVDRVRVKGERSPTESMFQFAERTAMGNRGIVDFVLDVATGVPSQAGLRGLTEAEKTELTGEVKGMHAQYQVALELKDLAENVVDPAKFDNRILDAIANAPGQLGYTAQAMVPVVGIPLLVNSTKAMRTRELMQRGVPLTEATKLAAVSAVVEAPIEWVQSKMLFGRIPGMGEVLTKPLTKATAAALAGRASKVFAAEFGLQNVQEAVQDATPMLMQQVAAQWDEAVPQTTKADWLEFASSRIDTAFTLLPITLIGTGVASFKEGAYARAYLTNQTVLEAAGFTPEAAASIKGEPTLAGAHAKVSAMWTDPEARKVGTETQTAAAAQLDSQNAAQIEGMAAGAAERNADGSFTVRDADGQVVDTTATPEDAAELMAQGIDAAYGGTREYKPAVRAPDGRIFTGDVHFAPDRTENSAVAAAESAGVTGGERGYVTPDGQFLTLMEVGRREMAKNVQGFEASNAVEASPLGMQMPNAPSVAFSAATDQRTDAPAVINSFAKVMESVDSPGSALNRVGRMRRMMGGKALGYFQVRERITRIRTANDVSTAAHEMAHALEDVLFGKGAVWQHNKAVPQSGRAELLQLGKDLYGGTNPQGGYHSEGFAEFNRLFLTDPAKAKQKAPEFSKFWEAELAKRPDLKAAVMQAQQLGTTWFQQGSKARAESGIVGQPSRLQKVKDAAAEQSGKFYRNFIEQASAIEDFTKEAAERLGKAVPVEMDPMLTLTSRRLTADSVVEYMANKGMLDFAGNVTGKPLVEAFQLVKDSQQDFLLYLWAKRAIALWTDPNGPRNPGLDRADAEYLVALMETPQFQRAAAIVYEWNNGVLDYAAQASPDFAKTVEQIRKADPGFYIPLHREFEAFDDRVRGAGGVKGKNLVAKLKGSGRRIKDPVESMLTHAKAIVLKAQQKRVLDQIMTLADKVPGLGHYVVEVPADQVPAASASLMSVIEKANKALGELGGGLKVTGAKAMEAAGVDLNSEVLTFFAPAMQPKQNENPVLPVYRNGKVRWYEMDGDLYAALSGMDTYRLPKALDILLGIPARTMRLGTTGLRASFSLVTNPLRDLRTLHLNSRSSANTAKLFFDWLGMMKDTALSAVTNGKASSQWVDLAERLGVEMAQPLGQDSRPLERASRRLKRGGEWRAWDPRDQYDFVVGLFQFTETAARLTEIKNVAKDMGWDPSQPLTEEVAARLAQAGKQVTTDFTQAGSIARAVNQAVPFFNAGIQGPVAHVRALKADPTKFAIRGLMLTSLALANWWRIKDEEWWQEMPLKERYAYTYVPVGDELVRIPRAFEADGLFMAGAEALAEAWYYEDPKQAAEWFGRWLGGFTQFDMVDGIPVPPLPVLAQMTAEQLANKDFFGESPIVPESQGDLAPEEQFGNYTARASIKIGEVFGVSPRRVDHAINSIFGGVGSDLVGLLGRGNRDLIDREYEASDFPVLGVLFQRGGQNARNPESVEKLYDMYGERLQNQRSRFKNETFDQQQQRMMLTDAIRAVAILEDVKLLTADKASRGQLETEQIAVARDVVKAITEGRVDRGPALSAKGRANILQYQKAQELGLTPKAGDKRPLRTFAMAGGNE